MPKAKRQVQKKPVNEQIVPIDIPAENRIQPGGSDKETLLRESFRGAGRV